MAGRNSVVSFEVWKDLGEVQRCRRRAMMIGNEVWCHELVLPGLVVGKQLAYPRNQIDVSRQEIL